MSNKEQVDLFDDSEMLESDNIYDVPNFKPNDKVRFVDNEIKEIFSKQVDDYANVVCYEVLRRANALIMSGVCSMQDLSYFAKLQNDIRVGIQSQAKFSGSRTIYNDAEEGSKLLPVSIEIKMVDAS
jgi:hypothetical protein